MNFGSTIRINKIGFCLICTVIIFMIIYFSPTKMTYERSKGVVSLKSLLMAALEAAEKGGMQVSKVSESSLNEASKGETREGVNIPVTDADYKSHCVMFYGLSEIFPMLKIISEEKKEKEKCEHVSPLDVAPPDPSLSQIEDEKVDASKITVWIDPLDATREFTEKLFQYVTTMVCVAYEGRPIIGVIHKPFGPKPRTSWAWVNKANSFGHQIPESVGPNTVIISRSHAGKVGEKAKKVFKTDDLRIIEAGGSGYKSLEVAVGNVTAYAHVTDISKWDICSGDAIITALGGRFTDFDGREIDYSAESDPISRSGVLAASLKKHSQLINNVQD